jgi:hypothetical protein
VERRLSRSIRQKRSVGQSYDADDEDENQCFAKRARQTFGIHPWQACLVEDDGEKYEGAQEYVVDNEMEDASDNEREVTSAEDGERDDDQASVSMDEGTTPITPGFIRPKPKHVVFENAFPEQ